MQYALIGKSLKHSFSKSYFHKKFEHENIKNANYELIELQELDEIKKIIKEKNIQGLNITIPYKKEILAYCDQIDKVAHEIGSVNVLQINNGKIKGYNTDYIGFAQSISSFENKIKKAIILGNGGATQAIKYVLEQRKIDYITVSRQSPINYTNFHFQDFPQHNFVVQCTPVGTFPNVLDILPLDFSCINEEYILYDLIYNPAETAFLKQGKIKNATIKNGLHMLQIQAEESWKIWTAIS